MIARMPPPSRDQTRRAFVQGSCAVLALLSTPVVVLAADGPPIKGAMKAFEPVDSPEPLPDIAYERENGANGAVSDHEGGFVLLNLWATWCAPCVREMPALDRLQAQFDPDRLLVMPLSLDRAGARAVKPFYDKTGLDRLSIFLDKKSRAMRALRPAGLPTTYLIGPSGLMLGVLEGPAEWDSADAVTLLTWYLEHHRGGALPAASET